jgi:hypothetical protein
VKYVTGEDSSVVHRQGFNFTDLSECWVGTGCLGTISPLAWPVVRPAGCILTSSQQSCVSESACTAALCTETYASVVRRFWQSRKADVVKTQHIVTLQSNVPSCDVPYTSYHTANSSRFHQNPPCKRYTFRRSFQTSLSIARQLYE